MKVTIVAVDPTSIETKPFANFVDTVASLREQGRIEEIVVVAVMHHAQFVVPYSWYWQAKDKYEAELRAKFSRAVGERLGSVELVVLHSASSHPEDVADALNTYASSIGASEFVLLQQDKGLLARVVLGSVGSAMRRTKRIPVSVVDPETNSMEEVVYRN